MICFYYFAYSFADFRFAPYVYLLVVIDRFAILKD